jgi:hypothetical protein
MAEHRMSPREEQAPRLATMSEYDFVEKPFLIQLAALGWEMLDQGQGFPSDPTKSLRASFGDVVFPDVFRKAVRTVPGTVYLILIQARE